jgi:curved DNA-binding protein CbpA
MSRQLMPDYYAILEVSPTASSNEIKHAYHKLALLWHPDKNTNNRAIAEEKFKLIGTAYDILSDESKRRLYDSNRGPSGSASQSSSQQSQQSYEYYTTHYQDSFGSEGGDYYDETDDASSSPQEPSDADLNQLFLHYAAQFNKTESADIFNRFNREQKKTIVEVLTELEKGGMLNEEYFRLVLQNTSIEKIKIQLILVLSRQQILSPSNIDRFFSSNFSYRVLEWLFDYGLKPFSDRKNTHITQGQYEAILSVLFSEEITQDHLDWLDMGFRHLEQNRLLTGFFITVLLDQLKTSASVNTHLVGLMVRHFNALSFDVLEAKSNNANRGPRLHAQRELVNPSLLQQIENFIALMKKPDVTVSEMTEMGSEMYRIFSEAPENDLAQKLKQDVENIFRVINIPFDSSSNRPEANGAA